MERKLGKDRKYVVADMHQKKKHVIQPAVITLTQCVAKMAQSVIVKRQSIIEDICSDKSLLMSLSKVKTVPSDEVQKQDEEDSRKYISRVVAKYKIETTEQKAGAFEQFISLAKETRDYLEYYLKKFDKEYSQLLTPALREGKSIILCLLKNHFAFFKNNSPELNDRLLLSLEINPLNDFSSIDWGKYNTIRKFVIQKDFDTLESVKFFLNFFFQKDEKFISRSVFKQTMRIMVQKIDRKLIIAKQKTITEKILQKADRKGVFGSSGLISPNKLREIILHQDLFFNQDIMSIIFNEY